MSEGTQRRLAAIVAIDVAGYSRLMGADENGTLAALKGHREGTFPLGQAHGGRVVGTAGDGELWEFPSVTEAVTCAVEVQALIAVRNANLPDNKKMLYRIGINLGDVMIDGDDIYGEGINVAARLEALAAPGGICISAMVRDGVRDRLELNFEDMGEIEVKNIARPVRVFRVLKEGEEPSELMTVTARPIWQSAVMGIGLLVLLIGGGGAWWWLQQPDFEPADPKKIAIKLPEKPSIAVLPFANLSDDKDQEYFADGMTDDLITDLSKVSGLIVIARNSVFTYKGKNVKVQEIAKDLNVTHVLEGSVRRAGDSVRINAKLIDAASGENLWAARFDERFDNVFQIQDRISRRIVVALKGALSTEDKTRLAQILKPANSRAYDLLLQGRQQLAKLDYKSFLKAGRFFEQAIKADPGYARAYVNLGFFHWNSWRNWGDDRSDNLAKALAMGKRAVDLDPISAGAHTLLALAYQYQSDHNNAALHGDKALALNPTQAETLGNLGGFLRHDSRYSAAAEVLRRAIRLDPKHPIQWMAWLGECYLHLGEHNTAIEILQNAIAREPDYLASHLYLAASYAETGKLELAQQEAKTVLKLNPNFTLSAYKRYSRNSYRDPAGPYRMANTLLKAGLPEE